MNNLRLFTSNRLEILAHELADVLAKPLPSPLDEEIIIVQSKGMERWISMQLAHHHGICANCRFPFPNTFISEIFGKVIPGIPKSSFFHPEIMTWKIMRFLPSCISMPGFEDIVTYLRGTRGNLKALQLAEWIGDIFDQYLLFRPEMILHWENGEGNHWQAKLWRELVKGHEKEHRVALGKAFHRALKESSFDIEALPDRVSVFGISAIPRFYIEVLAGISRFKEVNLFLMNPCREYWAYIVSEWEIKSTTSKQGAPDLTPGVLYLEKGNSLLASMGALGRDFFDFVNEFEYEEFVSFEDPDEENLLSIIQSDILNLRDRQQMCNEKRLISHNDLSIQIHSCHSPMREIEILHDQLLNMFKSDPSLIPGDILVMTPDIESYSPYIQAVFDLPVNDSKRIPFSIADRSMRKES
ncbi:MAG: exodeoxyribonuclease V subunit gamma, partial [Thermodesulfobacteriota bacterium]|nr:exodeoxyribonuclease V subunit gamma [Thermodesulfobacteriota bacterium]